MHELSLCQAIVDTVTSRSEGRAVRRVNARIGHLRQVVPSSLQFAWEVITDGTSLAGCELAIEHVPAVIVCDTCGARTTLVHPLLLCGECQSTSVTLVSGEEFQLASMDIVEAAS